MKGQAGFAYEAIETHFLTGSFGCSLQRQIDKRYLYVVWIFFFKWFLKEVFILYIYTHLKLTELK